MSYKLGGLLITERKFSDKFWATSKRLTVCIFVCTYGKYMFKNLCSHRKVDWTDKLKVRLFNQSLTFFHLVYETLKVKGLGIHTGI